VVVQHGIRVRDLLTRAPVNWLPRVWHRVAFTIAATGAAGASGLLGRDYEWVNFCDAQTIEDNIVQQRCKSLDHHLWPFPRRDHACHLERGLLARPPRSRHRWGVGVDRRALRRGVRAVWPRPVAYRQIHRRPLGLGRRLQRQRVDLPSGARYWSVVDARFEMVSMFDAFLF